MALRDLFSSDASQETVPNSSRARRVLPRSRRLGLKRIKPFRSDTSNYHIPRQRKFEEIRSIEDTPAFDSSVSASRTGRVVSFAYSEVTPARLLSGHGIDISSQFRTSIAQRCASLLRAVARRARQPFCKLGFDRTQKNRYASWQMRIFIGTALLRCSPNRARRNNRKERDTFGRSVRATRVKVKGKEKSGARDINWRIFTFIKAIGGRGSKRRLWTAAILAANITRRSSSLGYNLKFVRGTISASNRDRY